MDEVNKFSIEEGLHLAVILKFSYGKPDLHEFHKVISNKKKLDIKGHCNIGQLEFLHLLIKLDLYEDFVHICFAKKTLLSIASAFGKSIVVDKATQERTYLWIKVRMWSNIKVMQEIINDKFQNKKEQGQLVPDDNAGERRDSRNNLGAVKDATVDRAIANSSEEATTFNSNNEENLEDKHKSIEAARWGVGKDEVLGLSNVVVTKQDNSIARSCRTLVSHKKMIVLSPQTIRFSIKTIIQRLSLIEKIHCNGMIHGTNELSTEFGSTLGKSQPIASVLKNTQNSVQFDKDVYNLGLVIRDLNKNREHVDQQVVLTRTSPLYEINK
ncbi:hypothetical protein H5410_026108 [Solanum commersonii]|uniref:Uncharacterized protein n=1 Tax=Solanum commersonii TaxID=4109 RepID=A0A9J5YXS8_SOLCO|nr:hypothetical protein H5410_026108 [Solanum commersonii]